MRQKDQGNASRIEHVSRLSVAWQEYCWARCRGSYSRFCGKKLSIPASIGYALMVLFERRH